MIDKSFSKGDVFFGFLLGVLLMLLILIAVDYSESNYSYSMELMNNSGNCSNLSLEDTALCLRNYVTDNFIYRVNWDNNSLTEEELFSEGGDCRDWALLYLSKIEDTDYYGEYVSFATEKKKGHAIAIISDNTGYCLLDQTRFPVCGDLKGDDGDE